MKEYFYCGNVAYEINPYQRKVGQEKQRELDKALSKVKPINQAEGYVIITKEGVSAL